MIIARDIAALRAAVRAARLRGERIAFVPTMGALHAGHLSLLDQARARGECVVLSIFVNPLQFAPTEDLAKYPRTEEADLAAAEARGTTIAFVPTVQEMYPGPRAIGVVAEQIAGRWEGAIRPGHFAGVLTVVLKLFNMVQPDCAVFGQKDLQQATLIRAMIAELNLPVELVVAPIVREPDGLAMSSRNRYLDPSQRVTARSLSRALAAVTAGYQSGVRDTHALLAAGRAVLDQTPGLSVDYLDLVEPERLEPTRNAGDDTSVILAARVGATRLLDNHRLGDPFPSLP